MNSILQMECSLFFQQNPCAFETAEGLAIRIGRNKDNLEEVLQILCDRDILEQIIEKGMVFYRYRIPEQTTIVRK